MPIGPFKAREKVPVTGIYTAHHYQHRMPHEVFAVEGDEFPVCRRCGGRIRFVLLQPAVHIESDQDFSKANTHHSSAKLTRVRHGKGSGSD